MAVAPSSVEVEEFAVRGVLSRRAKMTEITTVRVSKNSNQHMKSGHVAWIKINPDTQPSSEEPT